MFSGTEPFAVLDFLAQYTLQCRDLGLSESEAYISLRSFLRPTALYLFNAAKENSRDGDGAYNWPSCVNFLLRAYATDVNIESGIEKLNQVTQSPEENKETYALRLQRVHGKFGNYLRNHG